MWLCSQCGKGAGGKLHLPKRRLTLERIPREPAHRRPLELVIVEARVQRHERDRVLEGEPTALTRGQLGEQDAAALDRAAEARERRSLRGHEQMFAQLGD